MFKLLTALLVATIAVHAAPLSDDDGKKPKPNSHAEDYLEPYEQYHCRYIAINCKNQHGTTFFDKCCHPMLATETLAANRDESCDPKNHPAPETQYAACVDVPGAPVVAPSTTTTTAPPPATGGDDDDDEEECEDDDDSDNPTTPAPSGNGGNSNTGNSNNGADSNNGGDSNNGADSNNGGDANNAGNSNNGGDANNAGNSGNNGGGYSGSGEQHSGGFATYYYQNGVAGNCGTVNPETAFIAALPSAIYDGGAHCGQSITLTNSNNGKSVTVVVADSCPSCISNECLDLSYAAFTAIASESDGMVPITWSYN